LSREKAEKNYQIFSRKLVQNAYLTKENFYDKILLEIKKGDNHEV